jgi:hypothetical protein
MLIVSCAALLLATRLVAPGEKPRELRGVWVTASQVDSWSTPAKIAEAMEFLAESGANAVFPPAWAEGKATFPSTALKDALAVEPRGRDVLAGLVFEAHRLGLEVVPWLEPGIPCPSEAECALLKKRPELFARGKDGQVLLERGVARVNVADAAGQDLILAVALELCRDYDIDGLVGTEPFVRFRKEVGAVDADLIVMAPAGFSGPGAESAVRLPPIDAGEPEKGGERVIGYDRLREKDGGLARTLREGPWAEDALLPWRGGREWRPRASALDPVPGEGNWTWNAHEGEPQYLALDGGERGHATWTFTPREDGVYGLYVWVPSRDDQASRASYRIASAGGSRTIGIDATQAKNRGWVRLGDVRLEARKEIEVARLLAEEQDATKITAAGPLLPLLNRRAMRR